MSCSVALKPRHWHDSRPLQAPELADRIDGAIGEGSQFHQTYGYYAQGVGPETALLPQGWINRVHRVQSAATNQRVGYFQEASTSYIRQVEEPEPLE